MESKKDNCVKVMRWRALAIARWEHEGQLDKCDKPYIEHCIRVSSDVSNYLMEFGYCDINNIKRMQEVDDYQCVAMLHDIIEDTDMTLDELKEKGFNDNVINAIDCITRIKDEKYVDYINRLCYNDIARLVKIMDLQHNMDLDRGYKAFGKKFGDIFKRYFKAYCKLMDVQSKWELKNRRKYK